MRGDRISADGGIEPIVSFVFKLLESDTLGGPNIPCIHHIRTVSTSMYLSFAILPFAVPKNSSVIFRMMLRLNDIIKYCA